MDRFFRALWIYAATQYSWATAWRLGADEAPKHIDAPFRAEERDDGFEYVVPMPRPE